MNKDYIEEHDRLNAAFNSGSIFDADVDELKRLWLAAVETKVKSDENQLRNQRRADALLAILTMRRKDKEVRIALGLGAEMGSGYGS